MALDSRVIRLTSSFAPFFTRKPDGMGLGLYYANLAMELNGGYLAFPGQGEVDIPEEYDGAVVAMIFKANK